MATQTRNLLMAGLLGLLVACGGGGGGDRAAGVDPGPADPGGAVPPPAPVQPAPVPPAPYAEAEVLLPTITSVTLDGDNRPIVDFQLTDGAGTAITDLGNRDVRFTIVKLMPSPLGSQTGTWQSYRNQIEDPKPGVVGPGTESRLQATYERDDGDDDPEELVNNGDGTYTYHFGLSLSDPDGQDQAAAEGLDLSFDPSLPHRVAMQFDGAPGKANPFYDWVPATGATTGFSSRDIAATANCNNCHDPLALHGSGRREIQYCVTCHNPGSTDANSGNTVDMKVMIHKIHSGRHLPSVEAGGEYAIWGFRDSKHDYSHLGYPQDIRNCVNCHAGNVTGAGMEDFLTLTNQGDNWNEYPSAEACGSCHDDKLLPGEHIDRNLEENCSSCHSESGFAGTIADSHRMLVEEAREDFVAEIVGVDNTMPGETPVVNFRINNADGEAYDLKNDPAFTSDSTRLAIGVSWDTRDYNNIGNGGANASARQVQDISQFVENGDGSYAATMAAPIPDGTEAPGIAASGSGVAVIEGHPAAELPVGERGALEEVEVPLTNVHQIFSINEANGVPVKRRDDRDDPPVDLDKCLACHSSLSLHGGNRNDNIDSCVTCHNPRNTDLVVRALPGCEQPSDGKREESIDFKTMIHAIHAAGIREHPLQVVGFRCFSTHVYDEEEVHYPGNLANCTTCHNDDGYILPLAEGVLATTVDTGADVADPADDTMVTPISSVCSSCHDGAEAKSHMTAQGGSFSTNQAAIDSGEVVESCNVCHGEDSDYDVVKVHEAFLVR